MKNFVPNSAKRNWRIAILAPFCLASPAFAQNCSEISFLTNPSIPATSFSTDISGDGSTVVGGWSGGVAIRWTQATGVQQLGTLAGVRSVARAVSHDGSVVVGYSVDANEVVRPFRWTAATGMTQLFPFGSTFTSGFANGISSDGDTVVGWVETNSAVRAFRWNAASGLLLIPTPGDGARATAVSADGSIVVGSWGSVSGGFSHAFRWNSSTGFQDLGTLGGNVSEADAMTPDGSWIVGTVQIASGQYLAARWSVPTGWLPLGPLQEGDSYGRDISADGKQVVGHFMTWNWDPIPPFVWTESTGFNSTLIFGLDYANQYGGAAISDSGDRIAGLGWLGSTWWGMGIWDREGVGMPYCGEALPNQTGCRGRLIANGSQTAADNNLTLVATNLPIFQFGMMLSGNWQTVTPLAGAGTLCLGGSIGRFNGPGQVQSSGLTGEISLTLDLTQIPTPTGMASIQAGETWYFQCWHREPLPLGGSNFTRGLAITFE